MITPPLSYRPSNPEMVTLHSDSIYVMHQLRRYGQMTLAQLTEFSNMSVENITRALANLSELKMVSCRHLDEGQLIIPLQF